MIDRVPMIAAQLPPKTALDVSSMRPSEIARHRAEIAVAVEVIMHGYWRDDMPDAMRAAIIADWCDEMEPWPVESIRAALRKHRSDNPGKKPNPGHILQILNKAWGEKNAALVQDAIREWERQRSASALPDSASATLTPEEAAVRKAETDQILADLLGSLKDKSAQEEADAAARSQAAADSYQRFRQPPTQEAAE